MIKRIRYPLKVSATTLKFEGFHFKMFSYFQKGIKDTNPVKSIDISQLIKIIKDNPEKSKIDWIRVLRKQGNQEYKKLKDELPNITPNCMVKYRALKEEKFDLNFITSSSYIYFDIDGVEDIDSSKKEFIEKYGHQVTMVCKSSSCGGLSILFKITNTIKSEDEFFLIWDIIRTTILKEEKIDIRCKDIGRAMFISYDSDVFVNYENEITIDTSKSKKEINTSKEGVKHPISINNTNNRVSYPFSENEKPPIIPINQVLSKLIRNTNVSVDNPIVDFKPIEYAEVFIPKHIKDETKHTIYTSIIHQLVYLNPTIEKEYIFSYLWFINNTNARPKMEKRVLIRLFNMVYNGIKTSGITYHSTYTKWVHFNHQFRLTGKEKNILANTLNGYNRKNQSIKKIISVKEDLTRKGEKITRVKVSKLTGLSPKTVKTYFKNNSIDMDKVIQEMNDPNYEILKDKKLDMSLKRRSLNPGGITILTEQIHSDCPRWAFELN